MHLAAAERLIGIVLKRCLSIHYKRVTSEEELLGATQGRWHKHVPCVKEFSKKFEEMLEETHQDMAASLISRSARASFLHVKKKRR